MRRWFSTKCNMSPLKLKRFKIMAAGLLAALTLVLAGCSSGTGSQDAVTISRVTARAGKLVGGAVVSGKLEALNSANVVPKVAGRVASIPVDVGSEVAEGDLLVSLDAAELAALVDLYAAQLDKARNSDLPTQKNQMELALANAEANLKTAEADYKRNKQLKDASVISVQQLEQSEKLYVQARAAYEAAQKGLDIMVYSTIPETIRLNDAQLQKARADFANSIIKAPINGVVTARYINPGEMAGTTQPVVSLVSLDTVAVQASVGEDQINYLRAGQELRVKLSSVREEPFAGVVTNVALAASSATKAYPVKVQINNNNHILKPGMYAEVLLSNRDEEGIIVPREAVGKSDDKSFVWIIEGGQVSLREVVAGQSDGKNIIVKSGLKEGEEVAITGIEALKEGAKINIQ